MIKKHCFTVEWLNKFKAQKEYQKIDIAILEKMIYALHLLERIKTNGLNFIFKGGTSLILLLKEGNRFSIDIDIITKTERKSLEHILDKVIASSNFKSFKYDESRSLMDGIPKIHYSFTFDPVAKGKFSGQIFLDVLIEDNHYPELIEKSIQTKWIETDADTKIFLPSIDSIVGDKLTAFAPNTIGIPYFKGSNQQSFSMEICKQLFDLSKMFEKINNIDIVAKSFKAFANKEIEYRKSRLYYLTPEKALQDSIDTCAILAKNGKGSKDEKLKFEELQKGIKAFGSGFLMKGKFRIDDAIQAAARVAYISAKLLYNDLSPIEYYNKQNIKTMNIENQNWNFLNRLKRQPNKSGYFYWYKTLEIMNLIN